MILLFFSTATDGSEFAVRPIVLTAEWNVINVVSRYDTFAVTCRANVFEVLA